MTHTDARRPPQRQDLADKEKSEVAIIETYMPARLDEAEIDALIRDSITESGATSARDMGKVMAKTHIKSVGDG